MASHADDDLTASKTEGYKAGEKKTVAEYAKLGRPTLMYISLYMTESLDILFLIVF